MILNRLSILNYKNITEANIEFAPKVNCLIGNNGMGKTNVLDAVYYLSMCKSHTGQADQTVLTHGSEYMMLQGHYTRHDVEEDITVSLQRGKRKVMRRGTKEYKRLSQHIGLMPVVMVSPSDADLISGPAEVRRRFVDMSISQGNSEYLANLIRYNKALEQRNSMIRNEVSDPLLYETVEQIMSAAATVIHRERAVWLEHFAPLFTRYYRDIAGDGEPVSIAYTSHLNDMTLEQALDQTRQRDLVIGYTTRGIHRDDLTLNLADHPMRLTASQGQSKTYTIALRLAQFEYMLGYCAATPLLLLDDIFDRLDASRVENIIRVVASERFGQIFITDTNREHLDRIMSRLEGDHAMMRVADGIVTGINIDRQ